MDVAQSASFIQSMTYEVGILEYEDFPQTEEPVWILGKHYSAIHELEDIKYDIKSRPWFTYRRGFSPIGGTGPTLDSGWGCMLRCGQMMLAQALIQRHLGRDWRWVEGKYDPKYLEILRLFLDKKSSCYSIHQIASMGASEGKSVGQWFGPNTIAHVIKKLVVYDEWSSVVLHVAMDNTVIINDINLGEIVQTLSEIRSRKKEALCKKECPRDNCRNRKQREAEPGIKWRPNSPNACACNGVSSYNGPGNPHSEGLGDSQESGASGSDKDLDPGTKGSAWQPLLLVIPLRLGLSEINSVYIESLKRCFTFKYTVGIIGGKPNHAHWFIGYVGNELIYLDPHTTQPFVDITQPGECDETYHCKYNSRMEFSYLDPSIALGFFCQTEADFDDLCLSIQKFIISGQKTPMFELHQARPAHWPPFQPYTRHTAASKIRSSPSEDRQYDTDEEFELL